MVRVKAKAIEEAFFLHLGHQRTADSHVPRVLTQSLAVNSSPDL